MGQAIPTPQDEQLRLTPLITLTASGNTGTPAAGDPGNPDGTSPGGFDHGYGYAPGMAGKDWAAVIQTTAIYLPNSGNQVYAAQLQESPDGANWTNIGTPQNITAVGVIALFAQKKMRFSRVVMTLSGTTPSITFQAWMNPNVGN